MYVYDMIWYDMIWNDMIWYGMIWYDMDQGSDKGGGVVQMVLVDTKRNA